MAIKLLQLVIILNLLFTTTDVSASLKSDIKFQPTEIRILDKVWQKSWLKLVEYSFVKTCFNLSLEEGGFKEIMIVITKCNILDDFTNGKPEIKKIKKSGDIYYCFKKSFKTYTFLKYFSGVFYARKPQCWLLSTNPIFGLNLTFHEFHLPHIRTSCSDEYVKIALVGASVKTRRYFCGVLSTFGLLFGYDKNQVSVSTSIMVVYAII